MKKSLLLIIGFLIAFNLSYSQELDTKSTIDDFGLLLENEINEDISNFNQYFANDLFAKRMILNEADNDKLLEFNEKMNRIYSLETINQ